MIRGVQTRLSATRHVIGTQSGRPASQTRRMQGFSYERHLQDQHQKMWHVPGYLLSTAARGPAPADPAGMEHSYSAQGCLRFLDGVCTIRGFAALWWAWASTIPKGSQLEILACLVTPIGAATQSRNQCSVLVADCVQTSDL